MLLENFPLTLLGLINLLIGTAFAAQVTSEKLVDYDTRMTLDLIGVVGLGEIDHVQPCLEEVLRCVGVDVVAKCDTLLRLHFDVLDTEHQYGAEEFLRCRLLQLDKLNLNIVQAEELTNDCRNAECFTLITIYQLQHGEEKLDVFFEVVEARIGLLEDWTCKEEDTDGSGKIFKNIDILQ